MVDGSGWPMEGTAPEAYERYIVPAWMEGWAKTLIERAGIGQGDRVLDVACGTGIVARRSVHLVGPDGKVAGLDADANMVRAAKQFAEREGIFSIEWHHGDALSIPVLTEAYDVVLCQQGLQFVRDRLGALQEMFRVMVPTGRLALSVWRSIDRCPFLAVLASVIEKYLGSQSTAAFYASCSLTGREELKAFIAGAGFCDVRIYLEVQMARYPSLQRLLHGYLSVFPFFSEIAGMPEKDRQWMLNEMIDLLSVFADDSGLAVPMECHIATARKYK